MDNNTKAKDSAKKRQMEITYEYEQSTPENARIIVKLFAEMLRLYVNQRKALESKEISLLK